MHFFGILDMLRIFGVFLFYFKRSSASSFCVWFVSSVTQSFKIICLLHQLYPPRTYAPRICHKLSMALRFRLCGGHAKCFIRKREEKYLFIDCMC